MKIVKFILSAIFRLGAAFGFFGSLYWVWQDLSYGRWFYAFYMAMLAIIMAWFTVEPPWVWWQRHLPKKLPEK